MSISRRKRRLLHWRLIQCRSGGIGRRAWFRSMYSQGCGGSSPFFGTMYYCFLAPGKRSGDQRSHERRDADRRTKRQRQLLGFVLRSKGSLASGRYMELKGEYLRIESPIAKCRKSGWLRYYLFDHRFIFNSQHRHELEALIASFRADYLRAAKLFEELGSPMAASAYY